MKKDLTDLFEMGHNASSARHAHEQQLLYEAGVNNQEILADRAQNPNPQDVYRLYDKWRLGSYGNDNGESVVLQKLSLNILILCLEKNPHLLFMSVESSPGSVEGSGGN